MGVIKRIHHLGLITKSFSEIYDYLIQSFGFQVVGNFKERCALRSGSATVVAKPALDNNISKVDSVYDIALEVDDIESLLNKAITYGVEILSPLNTIHDLYGSVDIAQIRSCVGNVVHTLINSRSYSGSFLPGYETHSSISFEQCSVRHVDHITFAVHSGCSDSIIDWYHKLFGMKRIKINSDDSVTDGFVVRHKNTGMRLKAFDYWKCAKVGLTNKEDSCKFIIAEELSESAPNQIGTFLREHGGPGIQHVGLLVDDIESTARRFHLNGAKFMTPPKQYYQLIEKQLAIRDLNISLAELAKYGILIDYEHPTQSDKGEPHKYLLQTFTTPIFDRNTFFLELIERQGATGFGSGNIKALWDAVDATFISAQIDSLPRF